MSATGQALPCYDPKQGWFNSRDRCYYKPVLPAPPATDPVWAGHYPDGTVYRFNCTGQAVFGGLRWLADPPAGQAAAQVTPEQLAHRALASVTLPRPAVRRSPTEANSEHGVPYTWVNLWTWFWTGPDTWRPHTARAEAGAVRATVTVAPTRLVVSPGDWGADVACDGPGRAWRNSDGNDAPTDGGCGYRYRHVSAGPVTATVTIEWSVTWQGSGGTNGTLPVMRTQTTSAFSVQQLQVVTR